jgi:hypothetical protein
MVSHMNSSELRSRRLRNRAALAVLLAAASSVVACSSSSGGGGTGRVEGQSDFTSSPPGQSFGGGLAQDSAGTGSTGGGNAAGLSAPMAAKSGSVVASSSTPRTVEETDLYRVEGNRLYYLNGYRGLMVFDISDIDHPKLIGRSAIFGSPVEMVVHNGVAVVVVADWYGHMDDGSPFHGSIVRGIDASNPDSIKIIGEAQLGGDVRDTRFVGDATTGNGVLYAVSEEYPWAYGWGDVSFGVAGGVAVSSSSNQAKVVVSSVSINNGVVKAKGRVEAPGYGGIFNVTPNSIMFGHTVQPPQPSPNVYVQPTQMALDYIDISDPAGTIKLRGEAVFSGNLIDYGTDNGRWNLDFADGKTAHLLGRSVDANNPGVNQSYVLAVADFTNPDAPVATATLGVAGNGWTPAARFDKGRMYLAPSDGYYYGNGQNPATPIQIFDITNPKAPAFAGQTQISGAVWNFTPSGDGTRLFALGNQAYNPQTGVNGSQITVEYLDVTDATNPMVLGNASFGQGWAWTPAAGTFKAFTKSDADGLVVLPFSGWDSGYDKYNNGLQLIEFTNTTIRSSGTAATKGWVERGIFAKGSGANAPTRLLSLSDLSLAVVDYTQHDAPAVKYELPLARNVIDARPNTNGTISQLSSDWWYENDQEHSELRVLPIAQADENRSDLALAEVPIEGVDAQVFHNGKLAYVVTSVRHEVDCATAGGGIIEPGIPGSAGTPQKCYRWGQQIQVVDFSGTTPVLRGKQAMPDFANNYYWAYGGFYGCYIYDWYYGADMVQVGGDKLAFRRWVPQFGPNGEYVDAYQSLWIVDLSNPDSPNLASTVITRDQDGWWGNMRAVGDTLYTTHYEWVQRPTTSSNQGDYQVKYFLDRIDMTDPRNPKIGAKINVPGMLIGASETDPGVIYTIDYGWYGNHGGNAFDVLRLSGDKAYLQEELEIPGYVGNTFVRGNNVYMSVQQWADEKYQQTYMRLWQLDITDPKNVIATASKADKGWGWLLGVEGDRALVTSGWGSDGIDIYQLSSGAPKFDQFVRTLGWGSTSMARQGDQIFLASGHWGVQTINLK